VLDLSCFKAIDCEEEEVFDIVMSVEEEEEDENHDIRQDKNTSATTTVIDDADADTIRIIVSTDNHLGYSEGDTVRGCDSFAAMEEVLYLAKHYNADMVLLAGDLFHHNKPSRRTLMKTMDLFRRYCMGPNSIAIQILNSDQSNNFRRGCVNYQDENYSVDLPVFSIHGNHDDPAREGTELYAALDLLDVANLVNYVGRQDQVNQIQIAPILIKKGDTHLALYGLGSMRDERLNRMWRAQNLTFLRPEENSNSNDDDEEEAKTQWFNLFALHQNRDLGRGTKNCVHESMIPEWMDLVCWGHEHECCIEPQESVVGTFRITQPGSSVATSLTAGEAERKHIGILDVRGQQFRLLPIPLTQVRSFMLGDLSLTQQRRLDPEDPKVEQKVSKILEEKVRVLIHDAREKTQELLEAAKKAGNVLAGMLLDDEDDDFPLKNRVDKPDEVLVRLKVEHSGFSTLNNQRFGAKFIGEVANPVRCA
jgi:double-strand break repair protein MRE11